jgi:N-acetylglutamate synthase-like GNAT family acetyltransferase
MKVLIRKYQSNDYYDIINLLETEGDEWQDYLKPDYKTNLEKSITYVAVVDGIVRGYSRSLNDFNQFVWVIDLLVHKNFRGHSIGKQLLECICIEYPKIEVFVLSDVDEYYQKLGYKKEGSIFKVKSS